MLKNTSIGIIYSYFEHCIISYFEQSTICLLYYYYNHKVCRYIFCNILPRRPYVFPYFYHCFMLIFHIFYLFYFVATKSSHHKEDVMEDLIFIFKIKPVSLKVKKNYCDLHYYDLLHCSNNMKILSFIIPWECWGKKFSQNLFLRLALIHKNKVFSTAKKPLIHKNKFCSMLKNNNI